MEHNNANPVDELLDAALKRYGAAEPRPGLEARILANLGAVEKAPQPNWLWWPMAAICAAMLLLAATVFTLRVNRIKQQPTAHAIAPALQDRQPEVASNPGQGGGSTAGRATSIVRARRAHSTQILAAAATAIRQEQFPSPEPLSQQEQTLARYVEQFPREAGLVARAQTELFQREATEREASPADRNTQDTEEQNP